jgi:phosphatidylethanolamine-binding protein (PEBP) family uncharacterized protein
MEFIMLHFASPLRSILVCLLTINLYACGGSNQESGISKQDLTPAPIANNATLSGPRNNYHIELNTNEVLVIDKTGVETNRTFSLNDRLYFSDLIVDLELAKLVPQISELQLRSLIELYIAFFNRVPDSEGMNYWIRQLIAGQSIMQIADSFYTAGLVYPELTGYSANMSNRDFVKILYKNVLGRTGTSEPTEPELAYWTNDISSGQQTRSSVVIAMLNSARSLVDDPEVGWVTRLLNNKLSVGRYLSIEQGLSFLSGTENIQKSSAVASLVRVDDTDTAIAMIPLSDVTFTLSKTVPEAPTNITTVAGNGSISISFSPPKRDGGSPISTYLSICVSNGKSTQMQGSTSPIVVSGLSNGSVYSCSVKATNAIGNSNNSSTATATPQASTSEFKLLSTAGADGSSMAADYTCDGTGSTIPLSWSNPPAGTKEFAILMSTLPGDGSTKWNWVLYNIPVNINSLVKDSFGLGTLGVGSDGPMAAYQPPCSQGPGAKIYTYTIYALSSAPVLPSSGVITGAIIQDAIANITLASSRLNLSFTRTAMTGSSAACVNIRNSMNASNSGYAVVSCDANYAYVSSRGIPTHTMMNGITATNLQVPTIQKFNGANGWKIPITPKIAASTTTAVDGPIGVAVNGVPIFNPCKQGGCQNGDTKILGELDVCNGHAGRADDYHYHAAPTCVMSAKSPNYWDTHPIGWALDGFAIYGYNNIDGKPAPRDGICGGNTDAVTNGPSGYAYHVTDESPYVLSCFRGTPSPDLANQASKFTPMRQPPVTPFNVSSMTLSTDSNDGYQVLQFTSAKTFITNEIGSDSYTNPAGTYKIRYKALSGIDLSNALAQGKNSGKSVCWNFQFLNSSGATSQPSINYCR